MSFVPEILQFVFRWRLFVQPPLLFNVNPTLMNFYAADYSEYGEETLSFTGEAKSSMEMYDDAAVIVISREGGEGSGLDTATSELV